MIDRKNLSLDSMQNRLVIRGDDIKPQNIPLNGLAQVIITTNTTIQSHAITLLAENGIPLVILNPRSIKKTSLVYGVLHNHSQRRLNQYQLVYNELQKASLAKRLLQAKVMSQLRTLNQLKNNNKKHRFTLTKAIEQLQLLLVKAKQVAEDLNIIRGLEGACAAIYFGAYFGVFAPTLGLIKRVRRPATDPVNAILSLTYTLLYCECTNALYSAGLDPMLGVLHEPYYGRASLACDMSELFRAKLDLWVYQLFNQGTLRIEQFSETDNLKLPCMLMKSGRKQYYSHWQTKVVALRKLLRKTAYSWARDYLNGDVSQLEITKKDFS